MFYRTLVPYVLRALAIAQKKGRVVSLEDLSRSLEVRKTDVRAVVRALHREGYVDALRMRLSLAGFALGASLIHAELPPIVRPANDQSPARAA